MPDAQPPEQPTPPDRGLSQGAKWALALVAVAVVVIAFVVLQGGDDEPSGSPSTAATTTVAATTETATATETQTATAPAPTATAEPEPTATAEPEPAVATVRVVDGRPEGGVQTFVFHNGDRVRLRVSSDRADEVHVHGYDLTQEVAEGGEVEIEFEATLEGRFDVELHGSGTQIATIEVRP